MTEKRIYIHMYVCIKMYYILFMEKIPTFGPEAKYTPPKIGNFSAE